MPLKIYQELAAWWPLWSPPEDYLEEATFFAQVLKESAPGVRTLVEFGSGGGSNAFHLKAHYTLTLVDISPEMLAVSRAINPECEHLVGDMRSARLGRQFDLVFIHDAIDYMTTEADLRLAFETAFLHCKPGGVALFVPDHVHETFKPTTDHDEHDGEDGRALRVLEWQYDPDPTDSTYLMHFAFLLRENGEVHFEHDTHVCGLFARADWLGWLKEAGFQASSVIDQFGRDVFVAIKPRD
jgi:SAM-dependent methyltransferase